MTQAPQPIAFSASSSTDRLLELAALPAYELEKWWHVFAEEIEPALARTAKVDEPTLRELALAARVQCWVIWDIDQGMILGALVTQIVTYQLRKVGVIQLAAGREGRRWPALIGTLEAWARDHGCAALEVVGRRGWAKWLPGYEPIETTLSKEL